MNSSYIPSKKQKERSVLEEVNRLFDIFDPKNVNLKNMDDFNVSFNLTPKSKVDFDTLTDMGYEKSSNKNLAVYSKWNFEDAVASNVSVNNKSDIVTVSLNY